MKWIKASERLPSEIYKNYIFRQADNTRSAKQVWYEHCHGNVERYFKLPLYNLEWLDEQSPSPVSGSDAVAFADWIQNSNWWFEHADQLWYNGPNENNVKGITTELLYQQFNQKEE